MFSMFLVWSRWTLVWYREQNPGTGAPMVGRETILFGYVWIFQPSLRLESRVDKKATVCSNLELGEGGP